MRLSYVSPFSRAIHRRNAVQYAELAELKGYEGVWLPEAFGSDAFTLLGLLAGKTSRMTLATGIVNVYSRSPALLAQTFATLDEISDGRAVIGLGTSGPIVIENWHGQAFERPLTRTREAVEIIRLALQGERVDYDGECFQLRGFRMLIRPVQERIPIYLATLKPRAVRQTGEIADGWLPLGFVPGSLPEYLPWLEEGFKRAGNGKSLANFEIMANCHVFVDDDVQAALDAMKPETALYVGGMGARSKNFHKELMIRRGFGDAAERIQELYLAGRKEEAIAAVPDEWVDQKSLVGPPARIIERYRAWEDGGVTSLGVRTKQDEAVEVMAKAARLNA